MTSHLTEARPVAIGFAATQTIRAFCRTCTPNASKHCWE